MCLTAINYGQLAISIIVVGLLLNCYKNNLYGSVFLPWCSQLSLIQYIYVQALVMYILYIHVQIGSLIEFCCTNSFSHGCGPRILLTFKLQADICVRRPKL